MSRFPCRVYTQRSGSRERARAVSARQQPEAMNWLSRTASIAKSKVRSKGLDGSRNGRSRSSARSHAILSRVLPVRAILRYGGPCARVLPTLFVRGGRAGDLTDSGCRHGRSSAPEQMRLSA